jgi:hypothetical protein
MTVKLAPTQEEVLRELACREHGALPCRFSGVLLRAAHRLVERGYAIQISLDPRAFELTAAGADAYDELPASTDEDAQYLGTYTTVYDALRAEQARADATVSALELRMFAEAAPIEIRLDPAGPWELYADTLVSRTPRVMSIVTYADGSFRGRRCHDDTIQVAYRPAETAAPKQDRTPPLAGQTRVTTQHSMHRYVGAFEWNIAGEYAEPDWRLITDVDGSHYGTRYVSVAGDTEQWAEPTFATIRPVADPVERLPRSSWIEGCTCCSWFDGPFNPAADSTLARYLNPACPIHRAAYATVVDELPQREPAPVANSQLESLQGGDWQIRVGESWLTIGRVDTSTPNLVMLNYAEFPDGRPAYLAASYTHRGDKAVSIVRRSPRCIHCRRPISQDDHGTWSHPTPWGWFGCCLLGLDDVDPPVLPLAEPRLPRAGTGQIDPQGYRFGRQPRYQTYPITRDDPDAETSITVNGRRIGGVYRAGEQPGSDTYDGLWISYGPAGFSFHNPTREHAEDAQIAAYLQFPVFAGY